MTSLELTTAFAAAMNQYDTSLMEPLLHDTSFAFSSQMSFNEFNSKQEFLKFNVRVLEAIKAKHIELRAELAYTGDQSNSPMDRVGNIKMWVPSGQPCIYLVYRFPEPIQSSFLYLEVDKNGEPSIVSPIVQEEDAVICFDYKDGLISSVSFQLTCFHDCLRRTGELPGR